MALRKENVSFKEISVRLGLPQDNRDPGKRVRDFYNVAINPLFSQDRLTEEQKAYLLRRADEYFKALKIVEWVTISEEINTIFKVRYAPMKLKNTYHLHHRSIAREKRREEKLALRAAALNNVELLK